MVNINTTKSRCCICSFLFFQTHLHIDFMICICYNASRQKRYDYVPCEQRTSPGCTANTFEGSSLFISVVERPLGYLLSLSCLSNHLQMRWQVTPAATVTKKDMTISICSPPPVAGYRLDNTVSITYLLSFWKYKQFLEITKFQEIFYF